MTLYTGTAGPDVLTGGTGDDTLDGGLGADTFEGGGGSDTILYTHAAAPVGVFLTGGGSPAGEALGDVFVSVENVFGSSFGDTIFGNGLNNALHGGDGNDNLYGFGGLGTVTHLYGEGGDDTLIDGPGTDVIDGGAGENTVSFLLATAGVLIDLSNSTRNTGDAAGDTFVNVQDVIGSNHNDTIYGDGSALNQLQGQDGDDVIYGGTAAYTVLIGGVGADALHAGAGGNEIDYETATVGVVASLANPAINAGDAAGDTYFGLVNADLAGSPYNDTLYGDDQNNNIIGDPDVTAYLHSGADQLFGGGGDDNLQGGLGADTLDGGGGVDSTAYSTASAGVTADMLDPSHNTGDAAGDVYINVENLIGTLYADSLGGTDAGNVIFGSAGDDTLLGHGGDDVLDGGLGTDRLDGGPGYDHASYASSTVGLTVSLADPTQNTGEAAGDAFVSIEGILGSAGDDTLVGDGASNTLQAGSGNDLLFGGEGADLLAGGDGDDTLVGGPSTDVLSGGAGADVFRFATVTDSQATTTIVSDLISDFQTGIDKIDLSALHLTSYAFSVDGSGYDVLTAQTPTGVFAVRISGAVATGDVLTSNPGASMNGTAGADTLAGGSGDDVLTGGGGGDRLTGGGGLDVFRYTAATDSTSSAYDLITDFASGSDKIDLSAVTSGSVDVVGLGDAYFVFVGTPTGPMQIAVQGGALQPGDFVTGNPNLGFGVVGGTSNETFTGAGALDALNGGAGDDVLIGGAHGDVLTGGAGADVFRYLAATDSTPQSGDTITDFQTGVDKIDLSAVSPVNVNVIYAAGASFLFIPAGGITMQIGVTGQVSAGDLITAPGLGINVLGDSVAETLTGSANLDALNGGGGNDVVIGGGHGDVLTGGAGADVFRYAAASDSTAASYDIVTDFQTGTDTLDLSAVGLQSVSIIQQSGASFLFATTAQGPMQIAATGAFNGSDITGLTQGVAISVGDAATHGLVGSGFADTLSGGSAADVLIGGGGGDLLIGGGGADTFKYLAYADSPLGSPDAIADFRHGVDHIDISALHTAGSTFGLAVSGADTQVFIDQGGNGTNDALIIIQNTTTVSTADFVW